MTKTFIRYVILFALIELGVSGCFPYNFQKTPEVRGYVTDYLTKQPVKDAVVYYKRYPEEKVRTDDTGFFTILSRYEKGYYLLFGPFDVVPPHGDLVVEAEGFLTNELTGLVSHKPLEKNIELQKKNK
jgi:hypothetical protein